MSEVEKMYENAGIKAKWKDKRVKNTKTYYTEEQAKYLRQTTKNRNIQLLYPPFTAEKQLELVKWCCKKCRRFYIYNINDIDNFAENLAKEFNHYWQDLTEQEQEQIRSILE